MSGTILLLVAALTLRAAGAPLRMGNRGLFVRAAGWVLCTAAVWIAMAAAGAWFPLWPVLLLSMIGAVADFQLRRRQLWIGADMAVVVLSGLFSIPPLSLGLVVGAVVAIAWAGFAVDLLMGRASEPARAVVFVLLSAACVVRGMLSSHSMSHARSFAKVLLNTQLTPLFYIGLTPGHRGELVVLETGAVAWLERPSSGESFPGALFFHGAHHDGSQQSSAVILRRALLDAGFAVLSVDHPGYGGSPAPRLVDGDAVWDPLPTDLAALKALRAVSGVTDMFVIGHSKGTLDALRLLGAKPQVKGAILFGASLNAPLNERWYRRFHSERGLQYSLSQTRWREIQEHFYDRGQAAQALLPDHAPILFVRFGFEHANIIASRDVLYEMIPGRKATWDLVLSSHYFNSCEVGGLVIGDTRITRLLASRLRLLAANFGIGVETGQEWAVAGRAE